MIPDILKKLMEDFQKLPGIGEKTAERLALHVISNMESEDIKSFADHLFRVKDEIRTCPICHMITDHDLCGICSDPSRDHATLMVVADPKDVFVMERMRTYHGAYHVLGGLIDFSRGKTDKDLSIDALSQRIPNIRELIIATSGTVEGEMTAKYLKHLFDDPQLSVTRLAYGLPVGADLRYADELTLSKAVENRQKY